MARLEINPNRPPIYIGAGLLKHEGDFLSLVGEESLVAIIGGSYSEMEEFGHDDNGRKNVIWWDEANKAFYNSIGLKNPGRKAASEYLPRSLSALKDMGTLAILSVVAVQGEDPLKTLPTLVEWALEMGADAVEIDGSCRNVSELLLCTDIEHTGEVAGLIRQRVGNDPIIGFKVSNLRQTTINKFAKSNLPLDFYETMNALGHQPSPINPVTGEPGIEVNDGYASKSGPAICDIARNNLDNWVKALIGTDIQMLSIGGIDNGTEIYHRVHEQKAFMAGGVEEFHRANNPKLVAQRWAQEYVEANPNL